MPADEVPREPWSEGRVLVAGLLEDLVAHKYRHFGLGLSVRRGSTLAPAQSDLPQIVLVQINRQP